MIEGVKLAENGDSTKNDKNASQRHQYSTGRREVRRGSLRRRRFADAGLFCLQRLTPADVGGFWDPPKFQNGSKIALLCIDWRLELPKMASGKGFEKIEKSMKHMIEQQDQKSRKNGFKIH